MAQLRPFLTQRGPWFSQKGPFLNLGVYTVQLFFQKVSEEEDELISQQISEGKVSQTNNIFV